MAKEASCLTVARFYWLWRNLKEFLEKKVVIGFISPEEIKNRVQVMEVCKNY